MPDPVEQIDQLARAWEETKTANEERLKQLEKGSLDPLTLEKLNKTATAMDELKSKLDALASAPDRLAKLETVIGRVGDNDNGSKRDGSNDNEPAEHKGAVLSYIRKGDASALEAMGQKALSVGSDADGGYLVRPAVSARMITTIKERSPIRGLATVETITTDALELPEDRGTIACEWTSEVGTRSETATSNIGKQTIPTHEIFAEPRATQKMLDDAGMDIEGWLSQKASEAFGLKEADAFIGGDGVGKPRGILAYASGTSWGQIEQYGSGSNGDFDGDDLINLFFKIKSYYRNGSSWLMPRAAILKARLAKETVSGQYLWQPGLQAGVPNILLGRPVYEDEDMPAPGTGSLSVAFGDFRQGYTIVDRKGVTMLRDPFTAKPFVKFYFTRRLGGAVTNFEAIKLLLLSA